MPALILMLLLAACADDPVYSLPPPPESKLNTQEYYHFAAAKDCLGLDAVEPTVEYEAPVECSNHRKCCAAGCRPSIGQSCYWLEGNRVVVTSVEGGGCATVDLKLHVEMANAVGWQNGDFRDQFFERCGRL